MTVVKFYKPENRLAKVVAVAGGLTFEEAVESAAENLHAVREECARAIDVKIAAMDRLADGGALSVERAAQLYVTACDVLDEAGAIGLDELSEAGRSLCDLLAAAGQANARAVRVHIDSMKTLRFPEIAGAPELRAAVLQGLREVTEKLRAGPG